MFATMHIPIAGVVASLKAHCCGTPPPSKPSPTPAQRLSAKLHPITFGSTRSLVTARALADEISSQQGSPLTGVWKKDKTASGDMSLACELVRLPWVLQKALVLLNTLEITDSASHFETNLKAGGLMDVVERYPWSGDTVTHARRDKRRGKHVGRVARNEDGAPVISVTWDEPLGGEGTDTFVVSPDGEVLTQVSWMKMAGDGREARYDTVFRRVRH